MKSLALACAVALSAALPAAAQDPLPQDIKMSAGMIRMFRSPEPFTDVLIGTTKVADVVVMTNQTLALHAHGVGFTTMVILGEDKQPIAIAEINVLPAEQAGRNLMRVRTFSEKTYHTFDYYCGPEDRGERPCDPSSTPPRAVNVGPPPPVIIAGPVLPPSQ